jgi:hypothetical protein
MWNPNDFCDADSGFEYCFARMHAIYGAAFEYHWANVDAEVVRQTWKEVCSPGLSYRPKMDYALQYISPDRPPSALQFAKLLSEGPPIPEKPNTQITRQKTQAELAEEKSRGEEARKQIAEMLAGLKMLKGVK